MNQTQHLASLFIVWPGVGKSGGERAALQTLRDCDAIFNIAKRLECGGFSTAFKTVTLIWNKNSR